MSQGTLTFSRDDELLAAWRRFRDANPHVYRTFCRFALEAARRGKKRIGAKAVWERMRWELVVQTTGTDFRLNNNYTAYAARDFLREHPGHEGLFETRRVKGGA